MTAKRSVLIVGSGASGVHYAQTALSLGLNVTMLDVGHSTSDVVQPFASLNELKRDLDDSVEYFLGERFESLIVPGIDDEYYGFPPNKHYVFGDVDDYIVRSKGFSPLLSFAAGGLAQAWTAGCYPLTKDEIADFPFDWKDLISYYGVVSERIGISGSSDDMDKFFPFHSGILEPLILDSHSQDLMSSYTQNKDHINRKLGFYVGLARIAALSNDLHGRQACKYLGRCLWGCPTQALYTPAITLAALRQNAAFKYIANVCVKHFGYDDSDRVTYVSVKNIDSGDEEKLPVETLVLAAGTIGTGRIVLESLHLQGERRELGGLMDNRQVFMPFVNLSRLGKRFNDKSYQYHQLAMAMPGIQSSDYVHATVTTLKTALLHPLVQSIPLSTRTSLSIVRNIHSALGLVNINFSDYRRPENKIVLKIEENGKITGLEVVYSPKPGEAESIQATSRRFRKLLMRLGCYAPRLMTRIRPMGSSVHYSGTLPMASGNQELTTDRTGRCRPFQNLIIADGSTLPSLPAKNLTFTLMANATRMASELFTD